MTGSGQEAPATSHAFARDGYAVITQLLDPGAAALFYNYAQKKARDGQLSRGDKALPETPSIYGDPAFDGLLEQVRPLIERHTGLALYWTYSYFRLYKNGDVLRRHRDRPACEISVTLNLGQDPTAPWPLFLAAPGGDIRALLMPGDALIYRGCALPHWREAYEGVQHAQLFLHYVDRAGPNADWKYDKRTLGSEAKDTPAG